VQIAVRTCLDRQKGDVNGDGSVTVADANLALRAAVGLAQLSNDCALRAADADCSQDVTVGDVVLLLRAFVGLATLAACSE
jgi:hypothetical protein